MAYTSNAAPRTVRPVSAPVVPPMHTMPPMPSSTSPRRSGGRVGRLIATLIIVVIVIGGGYVAFQYSGLASFGAIVQLRAPWQAVFLTNGQVYFGKVAKVNERVVVLRNIYYLQVVDQPLQQSADADAPAPNGTETEQRLTLIKLGNEIHGPYDEMTINWDQVILIEDLKDDGRVVQAINDYISRQP